MRAHEQRGIAMILEWLDIAAPGVPKHITSPTFETFWNQTPKAI